MQNNQSREITVLANIQGEPIKLHRYAKYTLHTYLILLWFFANAVISLQYPAIVIICCLLSVVCLSVTRVYCDKTADNRIMQFSPKCSQIINSLPVKFAEEILRGPLDRGLKAGWGVFLTLRSQKWCEIELRWLIGNHMWAFDCHKSRKIKKS